VGGAKYGAELTRDNLNNNSDQYLIGKVTMSEEDVVGGTGSNGENTDANGEEAEASREDTEEEWVELRGEDSSSEESENLDQVIEEVLAEVLFEVYGDRRQARGKKIEYYSSLYI